MLDTLKQLLQLQELDQEIMKREERLKTIPREIETIERRLEGEKMREKDVKEKIKVTKMRRKETEGKIEHLETTLNKYQNQLLEVKTNEGYTALLHEIDGVKGNIREFEEEVLEFMEIIENSESELESVMKELKDIEDSYQDETRILKEEKGRVEEEIAQIREKRRDLQSHLQVHDVNKYERVRAAIPVRPIAEVIEGGFCGGCYAQITLQRQAEIKKNTALMSCESCGRIVYYKDKINQL